MPPPREPGELDATARYAIQLAPEEVMRWAEPTLSADLAFSHWLDTEMIAFPGEPRRRCDTVAELVSRSGRQPPWALVVEVEARPRAAMVGRLPEYLLRVFRRVRHGPRNRDPYLVAGVLIVLTGEQRGMQVRMPLPDTPLGMGWSVGVMNVARQDAKDTLKQIADGLLGRGILPWLPLMAGADDAAVVDEWLRLVKLETDAERQRDYAGLARVFAEWVGRLPLWERAVEGTEMETWKSQTIETWRKQGRVQATRNNLLMTLQVRFQTEVPDDLRQAIEQTSDLEKVTAWFRHALRAPSLDDLRAVMQPRPEEPGNGATSP